LFGNLSGLLFPAIRHSFMRLAVRRQPQYCNLNIDVQVRPEASWSRRRDIARVVSCCPSIDRDSGVQDAAGRPIAV
jgi:hypothetical protein